MSAREEHIEVTKSARLYVLGEVGADDVWIACHGYGQLAGRFIVNFESIAQRGRLIVAPEGLHRCYLDPPPAPAAQRRVGATWMTREDRASDIRDYVAYLDSVATHVRAASVARVRAFGFSQGCATVFRWAVLGETRVDELILWGGEVPPDVDLNQAANRLADTFIRIVQGTSDVLSPMSRTRRHMAQLAEAGLRCELLEHPGGHELNPTLLATLAARV